LSGSRVVTFRCSGATWCAEAKGGLRESLHKSQSEFARMIGVSLATLQNWEQGRRKPVGPAQALLRVVQLQPDAVLKALAA